MATGIIGKRSRRCLREHGDAKSCKCPRAWQAWYWDASTGKKRFKTCDSYDEAQDWRARQRTGAVAEKQQARLVGPSPLPTIREASAIFLEAAERGEARSRKTRSPFKPATLRGYARDLARIDEDLGAVRLDELTPKDARALVGRLNASGLSGQSVRNCVVALQSLYSHYRHDVPSPLRDLDLPAPGQRRERVATASEAAALLAALPESDRALWATALYGGLRLGELRALRVSDVDLDAGTISVSRGWDVKLGPIEPKSRAGVRTIPAPSVLVELLRAHVDRTGRRGDALLFGRPDGGPFTDSYARKRAREAWACAAVGSFLRGERGDLEPIGLHESRHSFSSFMDAAGISETRADRYMGHANASVQARYRHQLAGQLAEDGARLNEYLTGAIEGKIVALPQAVAR
jgi:integrase